MLFSFNRILSRKYDKRKISYCLFFTIYKDDRKQQQNKYEYLLVDIKGKNSNVALVQLNRPKTFNSLCNGLMNEVWIEILYYIFNTEVSVVERVFSLLKLKLSQKQDDIDCLQGNFITDIPFYSSWLPF